MIFIGREEIPQAGFAVIQGGRQLSHQLLLGAVLLEYRLQRFHIEQMHAHRISDSPRQPVLILGDDPGSKGQSPLTDPYLPAGPEQHFDRYEISKISYDRSHQDRSDHPQNVHALPSPFRISPPANPSDASFSLYSVMRHNLLLIPPCAGRSTL